MKKRFLLGLFFSFFSFDFFRGKSCSMCVRRKSHLKYFHSWFSLQIPHSTLPVWLLRLLLFSDFVFGQKRPSTFASPNPRTFKAENLVGVKDFCDSNRDRWYFFFFTMLLRFASINRDTKLLFDILGKTAKKNHKNLRIWLETLFLEDGKNRDTNNAIDAAASTVRLKLTRLAHRRESSAVALLRSLGPSAQRY